MATSANQLAKSGKFGDLRRRLVFLLLALVVQYGVSPRIVARQDLKFWHGLGTLLYTLQWACALVTLWHTLRKSQPPQD